MIEIKNNIQSVIFPPFNTSEEDTATINLFCLLSVPPYTNERILVLPDPRNTELLLGRFLPRVFLKNEIDTQSKSPEGYAKEILKLIEDILLIRFSYDYFDSKWIEDDSYGQNQQTLVIKAGIRDPKYLPKPRATEFYLYDPDKDFETPEEGVFSFIQHIAEFAEKHDLLRINKKPNLKLNPYESFLINSQKIPAEGILALIGPNNSGKSFALKQWYFQAKSPNQIFQMDSSIKYSVTARSTSVIEARLILDKVKSTCQNEIWSLNSNKSKTKLSRSDIDEKSWLAMISLQLGIKLGDINIYDFYVSCCWKSINTQNRFEINERQAHDLCNPQNTLSKIYSESSQTDLNRINDFLHVFGYQIIPDTISNSGYVIPRFANSNENIEFRTQDNENIEKITNLKTIEDISDGVRAATGVALEYLSSSTTMCLIDEPESHLHISLQAQLGSYLARFITNTEKKSDNFENEKSISFATHSPYFFEQFILSGKKMNIVQFDRNQDHFGARMISFDKLKSTLLKNKFRQKQFCLAFFSKKVVIVEGHDDKLFYEEIYRRLAEISIDGLCNDICFLVGGGKPQATDLYQEILKFGINAHIILDFDALLYDKNDISELSKKSNKNLFSQEELDNINSAATLLKNSHDKELLKTNGVNSINDPSLKEDTTKLLKSLEKKNIHLVPTGEIESFMPEVQTPKGNKWVNEAMQKLGDIGSEEYLRPEKDKYNKLISDQDDKYWEFVFNFTQDF